MFHEFMKTSHWLWHPWKYLEQQTCYYAKFCHLIVEVQF